MPGTYDELREDLQAERNEPGAVTKAELDDLLAKHPAAPAAPAFPPASPPAAEPPKDGDDFFDASFFDPDFFE